MRAFSIPLSWACSNSRIAGKVHGSLARAGKVRGQTQKQAPMEKKKALTGRAKKRLQYLRKFVQQIHTVGGRELGPNNKIFRDQLIERREKAEAEAEA